MTADEIIRVLASFLGGGVVAAIGNWVHASRTARRQREIDRIREQLESLYGALFFFTSQNRQLFALNNDIHTAYSGYFGQKWSTDPATMKTLNEEASRTLELANAYIARVTANNDKVMAVLERGWHLVDEQDIEPLSRFQVDYTRYKVEADDSTRRGLPLAIYTAVGEISFMRPAMIDAVERAVMRKRDRLTELDGRSPGRMRLLQRRIAAVLRDAYRGSARLFSLRRLGGRR